MKPGIHEMTAALYHADPCPAPSLSNSISVELLFGSPRKAWFAHPKLNHDFRESHDDKFDLGTAAHALLLEGNQTKIAIVEAEDWRTKAAKEQRDQARSNGLTPILAKHNIAMQKMVQAAQTFIGSSEIVKEWPAAQSEQTIIWQEGEVWCRSRLDRLTNDHKIIIDYKTTTDASPDGFGRQITRMGYHIQEAFYRRAVGSLGVEATFVFLAQEVDPPYDCSLHGCDPAMQEIADALVERAIETWRRCLKTGVWEGYGSRVHWVTPPTYLMNQHEAWLAEQGDRA